jgi:hypothetical protein
VLNMPSLWVEYWLVSPDGERVGPFGSERDACEHVVSEKVSDYALQKIVSYLPF